MVCAGIAQTHTPASKKPTAIPLSRQFRKSALLAKVALDQYDNHLNDESVGRYREDAEKAMAGAQADVANGGDKKCYLLLLQYQTRIIELHSAYLEDAIAAQSGVASAGSEHTDLIQSLPGFGICVQNQLDDGKYTADCKSD